MTPSYPDLYQPDFEHDACGVGMVCRIDGTPKRDVIEQAMRILCRLDHRGGVGADPETGDGAGLLIQIPDSFFRRECLAQGIPLPPPGGYAVASLFISRAEGAMAAAMRVQPIPVSRVPTPAETSLRDLMAQTVRCVGLDVLGWRRVPVDRTAAGASARKSEPTVWQLIIGRPTQMQSDVEFQRRLFVARRGLERAYPQVYVVSMSAKTLVYKGMLTVDQLSRYYPDLMDPLLTSAVAIVHSRFSTNTLPGWELAHPFRFLAHNGEINTLRGNANWMAAREALSGDADFGAEGACLRNVLTRSGSDSQQFDQALELLLITGRSLPHAMMMLIPEAWEHHRHMDPDRRAFYEYHSCLMEPWDGPAAVLFSDGRYAGGLLDRNGLRPGRFAVTHDGYLMVGSEAGTLDLEASRVREYGRLQPGRMLLVDLQEGRLMEDAEIKATVTGQHPWRDWVTSHLQHVDELPIAGSNGELPDNLVPLWRQFGYTQESLDHMILPMARDGKESLGSMGRDIPLAVLSDQPRPLFDYFKQMFAQVTNPPLDAIREELVTSLLVNLGASGNLFDIGPHHAAMIRLDTPMLSVSQLAALEATGRSRTVPTLMSVKLGLEEALVHLCRSAAEAVKDGADILVLSDRDAGPDSMPIPSLLAVGAVHHHLIRLGLRLRCSLVASSGEPREVHHVACLVGFGANAVHPWLALETAERMLGMPSRPGVASEGLLQALAAGLLKVMSKMGISTVQSYCGAQIFEAVGVHEEVIDVAFAGTPSRIGGIGFRDIQDTYRFYHESALRPIEFAEPSIPEGGALSWRRDGEHHTLRPLVVARLQEAVRTNSGDAYTEFAALVNDQSLKLGSLRGLLEFVSPAGGISIDDVEPWTEIVKRFKTGAMSYGSISGEAHQALALAMNSLGGSSNTGEGGEDPERYAAGSPTRSRIKQVASGRFGVTMGYLCGADELQIKMAQGAKPGEGGQLPGQKVYPWIARTRHSTPWVGLISPPPHHDIYSIEDLAQLIFDLRNANPAARISVKLVSEAGVGTVAAGVAKAKADIVLISGHDGGTGASPRTSILHAGLPWELGLSEAHQTLVRNGLRDRIRVECDGGLRTGRDVAVAAALGADEFGFATIPLLALGCVMMRKCHLNTCPVGIATQDPELRARFQGQPEHVINYFHFVAEELRALMAGLGVRTVAELVGRTDMLYQRTSTHPRAKGIDLGRLLARPEPCRLAPARNGPASIDSMGEPRHTLGAVLDHEFVAAAGPAFERKERVEIRAAVNNTHRATGTLLSSYVVRAAGPGGLPDDTIRLELDGTAGQSLGAFGAAGLTIRLTGVTNDYLGKGLSGARLIVSPHSDVGFRPHEQTVVGNVGLYGATSGEVFIRGRAGERFAVRNSGASAVVEGVGDHGCEYMTGGRVVVLGPTGRNFAAGMSGGIAYVLDGTHDFRRGRCTARGVELLPVYEPEDVGTLRTLVEAHFRWTSSEVAAWALAHWEGALAEFVKVIPAEYRRALARLDWDETRHQGEYAAA